MSIRVMTVVWEIQFPTQSQKLIALKLADYASDTGSSIFPANESLAKRSGCDERTVQRTLKAFRECGILHLLKQGGGGPKDTNEWWLNVPLLRSLADGEATISGNGQHLEIGGGDAVENKGDSVSPIDPLRVTSDPLRVTPVSAKGDTSVTQSVTNHHKEPSKREGSKFDLKSEVATSGRQLTKSQHPEQIAAWRRYADLVGGQKNRFIVRMIDDHGACLVPSEYPPEIGLTAKSKRIIGDAA